ncbi:MAG TPA: MauE/DoxX family redox-associated membrane protein [Gaiellaceae bacterium]|nr:MauE/DoxX family redox-associated membrane protein [Gaiellaceae bacterium]
MSEVARILVGALLLWAAAAKLRRRGDLPDALAAYGLPARLARPAAWGVVVAEAAVGLFLLAGLALPASAYAAVALGALFVAALAQARLRGAERLRCGCFGASEGRTTLLLLRAAAFTALALVAAFGTGAEVAASRDTVVAVALAALAVAVVVLALLVLALYRQVGVLTLRLGPRVPLELAEEGPELGVPAPALESLRGRGPELVVFFSAGCRLCRQLAPGVSALARQGLAVHVVEDAHDELAFERWNVPGTPFVAHVIDGVVVAKGTVNTLEELESLLVTGSARAHAAA